MNRSRVLILLGVLLLVGAIAVLVILPQTLAPQQPPEQPTPIPQIQTTEILVAAQNIPRGAVISPDAVVPSKWPNDSLPPADLIITNPEKVVGQIARTDHQRHEVVEEASEDRHADEEHHRGAVHRQESVEDLRRNDAGIRKGELQAHRARLQTGDDEEDQPEADVHQAEALVVDGDHPLVHLAEQWQLCRVGREDYVLLNGHGS